MNFENQLTIVIGASSRIGKKVAKTLLQQGTKVILLDNDKQQLVSLYMQLKTDFENKVFFFEFDIDDKWQVFQFLDMVEQDFGSINNLVNCSDALALRSIKNITDSNKQSHFYKYTLQAIAKKMAKQKSSSIVTLETQLKNPLKQSLANLSQELNAFGVRFNILNSSVFNAQIPVKKMIEFENIISNTIIFLLSDKAKHRTIQDISIDSRAPLGCI